MEDIDWTGCPDVERVRGRLSGHWVVKDTRILARGVIENADAGVTAEEIGDEIFDRLGADRARRIIACARTHVAHPHPAWSEHTAWLRLALPGYEVIPARVMGWATVENGALIRVAEEAGFGILITCDRNNILYQT